MLLKNKSLDVFKSNDPVLKMLNIEYVSLQIQIEARYTTRKIH